MKSVFRFFSLSLITTIVFLCFGCKEQETTETRSYLDYTHIETIVDLVENQKSKIIYMYSNSCPYCETIKSLVFDYVDNHKSVAFLIRTEEIRAELADRFGIETAYVPAFLIIKDGQLDIETGFIWGTAEIKAYINK